MRDPGGPVARAIRSQRDSEIVTSLIVAAELRTGRPAKPRPACEPPSRHCCGWYRSPVLRSPLTLFMALSERTWKSSGIVLAPHDLLIAAHATMLQATLVTDDQVFGPNPGAHDRELDARVMEFRIADTFTAALARLAAPEQKATKTTAFDLQMDPSAPGLKFHRIDRSRDPHFWSVRASGDIRIIVHKTEASFLLAYVGHHDDAYGWAERRRIEAHPRTGAIQIVEVRARIEEIASRLPPPVRAGAGNRPRRCSGPFRPTNCWLIGVPADWVADVQAATEDGFLALADHLPAEAAEALLEYVSTGRLRPPAPVETPDPFTHPDALRRFRVVENQAELASGTRRAVGPMGGVPASGPAGHRGPEFCRPGADLRFGRNRQDRGRAAPGGAPRPPGAGRPRAADHVLAAARQCARAQAGGAAGAGLARAAPDHRRPLPQRCRRAVSARLRPPGASWPPTSRLPTRLPRLPTRSAPRASRRAFCCPNGGTSWTPGRSPMWRPTPRCRVWAARTGMSAGQRERLWPVFAAVRASLAKRGLATWPEIYGRAAAHHASRETKPFTHIVVDEAQDLGVAELRFLAAIAPPRPDALFFAGDLGQRIFQQPFSWKELGVDVRGRSSTLTVNYRTSHQIRRAADRLLPRARSRRGWERRRARPYRLGVQWAASRDTDPRYGGSRDRGGVCLDRSRDHRRHPRCRSGRVCSYTCRAAARPSCDRGSRLFMA